MVSSSVRCGMACCANAKQGMVYGAGKNGPVRRGVMRYGAEGQTVYGIRFDTVCCT